MPLSVGERRAKPRYRLQLAVVVAGNAQRGELRAVTRDISANGIFFYADVWPEEAREIEFRVVLPPEITLTTTMRAVCRGKVLRVERPRPDAPAGVAATIEGSSLT